MKYIGKFFLFIIAAVLVLMLVGAAIVLPLGLMGYGAYTAVWQDQAIRDAQPVPATILSSRVVSTTTRSGKSRTTRHVPTITYRYEVGGKAYKGERVTAHGQITNYARAEAIVRQHAPGASVQAWVKAGEPQRAFLLREYDGEPYFLFFLGLAVSLVPTGLVAPLVFYRNGKKNPQATGRIVLPVGKPLRTRVKVNVLRGIWFVGWTALGGWHLLTRMPEAPIWAAWGAIAVFTLIGVLFFHTAWRAQKVSGTVSDARVSVDLEQLRPGSWPVVYVEQELRSDMMVSQMKLGIICTKTVGSGKNSTTTTEYQQWVEEMPTRKSADTLAARVAAMSSGGGMSTGTLHASFKLEIPANMPPTSSAGPTIQWKLKFETELPGPNYREEFEIEVKA